MEFKNVKKILRFKITNSNDFSDLIRKETVKSKKKKTQKIKAF